MLSKMLIQGLIAASVIGVAAAAYSQAQGGPPDTGSLAAGPGVAGPRTAHEAREAGSRERHHDRDRDRERHAR